MKQSCWDLEQAMSDLQNTLEAKNASLSSSHRDLQVAEEQYQRLLAKVEEMRSSMLSKDSTGACAARRLRLIWRRCASEACSEDRPVVVGMCCGLYSLLICTQGAHFSACTWGCLGLRGWPFHSAWRVHRGGAGAACLFHRIAGLI